MRILHGKCKNEHKLVLLAVLKVRDKTPARSRAAGFIL
jgi:hypothetical protein